MQQVSGRSKMRIQPFGWMHGLVVNHGAPVPPPSEPGFRAAPQGGHIRVVVNPDCLTRLWSDGHREQHLPLKLPPFLSRLSLHVQKYKYSISAIARIGRTGFRYSTTCYACYQSAYAVENQKQRLVNSTETTIASFQQPYTPLYIYMYW